MNNLFKEAIKNDYYTPRIKSEVIFDTLLTPIIEEIIATKVKSDGQIKLIAKEFPLLTSRIKRLRNIATDECIKSSICVDYLLMDNTTLYLVELKTDNNSYNSEQYKSYSAFKNCENGAKYLYDDFITLLSYGKQGEKILQEFENNDLIINVQGQEKSAPFILSKILNEKYNGNEDHLLNEINMCVGNNRKYLWQLYKILQSTGKKKLMDIFYKENEEGSTSNIPKELEIIYIVPKKTDKLNKWPELKVVIELNDIVTGEIDFNYRETGYLNRSEDEFDAFWKSFQDIWKSLKLCDIDLT